MTATYTRCPNCHEHYTPDAATWPAWDTLRGYTVAMYPDTLTVLTTATLEQMREALASMDGTVNLDQVLRNYGYFAVVGVMARKEVMHAGEYPSRADLIGLNAVERRFHDSTIGTVCQTGAQLTERKVGVNVKLHLRDGVPVSAEVFSDDQSEYADIGLTFEGNALVDYDGVFELPAEVAAWLRELEFEVPRDEERRPDPDPAPRDYNDAEDIHDRPDSPRRQ